MSSTGEGERRPGAGGRGREEGDEGMEGMGWGGGVEQAAGGEAGVPGRTRVVPAELGMGYVNKV